MFRVGSANVNYFDEYWIYTGGATSGTWSVRVHVQPGEYEFRYLLDDGFVDVARSAVFAVRPAMHAAQIDWPHAGFVDDRGRLKHDESSAVSLAVARRDADES